MNVLLNDFIRQWIAIGPDAREVFDRVGASGWYILGDEVRRFESCLAEFWGLPQCVGVGNGLDAIEIGLRCLDIKDGDLVLTTPLSAFATTLAILRSGGVPVFVDVDRSGLLDLRLCREVLKRLPSIQFVVPVHLFGHALDLGELEGLKIDFGVVIVEDCAQSVGARSRGRTVGSVGNACATSFYPTKNLGCLGDGGALLTTDAAAAERARALRHYGQSTTYVHDRLGLNSRLDEVQAAILGDVMLPRLAEWNKCRAEIAARYRAEITNPVLRIPEPPVHSSSVWHLFPILTPPEKRAAFRGALEASGIQTGIHYPVLIPDQRALRFCEGVRVEGDLENAGVFAANEVSLPIHPFLSDRDVDAVIAACNRWRA